MQKAEPASDCTSAVFVDVDDETSAMNFDYTACVEQHQHLDDYHHHHQQQQQQCRHRRTTSQSASDNNNDNDDDDDNTENYTGENLYTIRI